MRPRSLELQGFTCFTERVSIDFDGLDVFAITGRTGSGKTTIMDALCYALYGKVPRGTDAGDLLSRDANRMHVALEFTAGEGRYRIVRRRSRTKSSSIADVQLERWLGGEDWEPLENRVKEANEAIERIVGLDYAAFTRCVLLPQGQFQQMLAGSREDRRKVLEDLLDIGIYDRIRAAARARGNEMQQEAKLTRGMLETTYAGATDEALAACKKEIIETKPRLDTETKRRDALMQASQHAAAWKQIREGEMERNVRLKQLRERLDAAEQLAKTGEEELARLRGLADLADRELNDIVYDHPRHLALTAARAAAEEVARCERAAGEARVAASDTSSVATAEAATREAAAEEAARKAHCDAAEAALADVQRAQSAAHVRSGLKKGDACPVCGGEVGKLPHIDTPELTGAQRTLESARRELERSRTRSGAAQEALALARQHAEHAVRAAADTEARLAEARGRLTAQLPEGEPVAVDELDGRLAELAAAERRRDDASKELEKRRAALDDQERAVTVSAKERVDLGGQISALERAATEDRARAEAAIGEVKALVARWQWGDVADLIESRTYPGEVLARMHGEADRECAELTKRLGTLEEQQRTLKEQIKEARQHRARLAQLESEGGLYADVADLLQANHFREWYIGEATGLLAESASARLETLDPDRRYRLSAKGLDFTVIDRWHADEERPPSTLSGGETFVVSLALALALAEQLPRIQSAAAAVLDSLFLDEGFGTLDADTLDPVMTALEGLRMEGRLVGIVTHVRELAERIGTRIEVRKSPSGSTLELITA